MTLFIRISGRIAVYIWPILQIYASHFTAGPASNGP
jgi:hypothetical protein